MYKSSDEMDFNGKNNDIDTINWRRRVCFQTHRFSLLLVHMMRDHLLCKACEAQHE